MFRVHGDWLTSPVLIGRSEELQQLRSALAAARATNGDLVLIAGQPGVGKSRILTELSASCDCLVVEGRCYEEDTAFPLAPLAGVLQSILSAGDDVGAAALVHSRTADVAYLTRDLSRPAQGTLPAPDTDPRPTSAGCSRP